MAINNNYLQSGFGRVWIASGQVGCGSPYVYHSCMQISGLSDPAGDISYDYCPDDYYPNRFSVASEIEGEPGNVAFTMRGPVLKSGASILRQLRVQRCAFDAQIKYSDCPPMTDPENWIMQWVIEGGKVSNYSVAELIARNPGSRALLEEEVPVSAPAGSLTQVYQLAWTAINNAVLAQGRIVDIIICDELNCAASGCGALPSNGCQRIIGAQIRANGLHLIWSIDSGATWASRLVETVVAPQNGYYHLTCCNGYLYLTTYNGNLQIRRADLSSLWAGSPLWVTVSQQQASTPATSLICVGTDNVVASRSSDLVVYNTITGATTITSPSISGIGATGVSRANFLAGGANGMVAYSDDLTNWSTSQAYQLVNGLAVPGGNIVDVQISDKYSWMAIDDSGVRYCTRDGGASWSATTSSSIRKTSMGTRSIGVGITESELHRTTAFWNTSRAQTLPAHGALLAAFTCGDDVNVALAAGASTDGSGGYIAIGKP